MSEETKTQVVNQPATQPEGTQAYRLGTTDRVEWLAPIQASIRNRNRRDGQRWEPAPDVPAKDVKTPVKTLPPAEWKKSLAEGIRRDSEHFASLDRAQQDAQNRAEAQKEDTDMAKDKETEKSSKVKKPKIEKKAETTKRPKWEGLGTCAWISYMGFKATFSSTRTFEIIKKMGLETTMKTVISYLGSGKRGKAVPELTNAQKKAFRELSDGVPETEEVKPKKEKKEKGEKPAKKIKREKTKVEPEAEEAEETEDEAAEETTTEAEPSDEERAAAVA
jgi:hypothetical protein